MITYWYKLLQCKSKGATGLTVPFLIGASTLLPSSRTWTISDLIVDISKNQNGKVMLRYCNTTRDFVLTINENFILAKTYINHLTFGNLLVVPEKNLKGLDELLHIIESFELDYAKLIKSGEYSIENGEAHEFSIKDLDFIKKCIKVQ